MSHVAAAHARTLKYRHHAPAPPSSRRCGTCGLGAMRFALSYMDTFAPPSRADGSVLLSISLQRRPPA